MEFKEMLKYAKAYDKRAMMDIIEMYRPLLISRSLHTNDGLDRENRGYQSEGYHDFDVPIHQNTSSTMDTDHSLNGLNTEEVRSQDRRNGAETRKSWEVPKSREELNQRNQKNHRRNEDDFLT